MSDWRCLDASAYAKFRAELLAEKGSVRQVEFLDGVKDGDEFLQEMNALPRAGTTEVELLPKPKRFLEGQFREPPRETEELIYEHWHGLVPAIASRTAFWAHVTLRHVSEGIVDPKFLAGNGVSGQTGATRIDRALARGEETPEKSNLQIDNCVRSVFRHLGGLPQARGNKSVFVDCPLSRSWWRERLACRVAKRTNLEKDEVAKVLRKTKAHWEAVVKTMVSRNPILGIESAQDALAASLPKLITCEETAGKEKEVYPAASHVEDVCQSMCFAAASLELGILEFKEILSITNSLVNKKLDEFKNA